MRNIMKSALIAIVLLMPELDAFLSRVQIEGDWKSSQEK